MNILRLPSCIRPPVAGVLLALLLIEAVSGVFTALVYELPRAEAAPVVIHATPNTDGTTHTSAGSRTVFISDLVGYHFYPNVSATDDCRYRKTTDGGASWGSPVIIDNQVDCLGVVVWYDQWTPGDTGTTIHILTMDSGDDDLFYNALDTTSDTLASTTARSIATVGSTTASFASNANRHSITKATDGKIYAVADDATGSGSILRRCSSNCTITANWSDVGTKPQGNADSWSMLLPLADGEVMLINRSTTELLRYSVWNGTIWSGFINIDSSAVRPATHDVGIGATLDTESGDIYLAYVTDSNNFTIGQADHDIRIAVYSGGSWTNQPDLVTNSTRGIHQVALSRDQNTGTIYLAYTAQQTYGTLNSSRVFYHLSTTSMQTWGPEQGPLDSSAGNFYGIDMNIMSNDRIYAVWMDANATVLDIFGETLANISPDARLVATGTQSSIVRAETNNSYMGGKFVLDAVATRTVTSVTITESGTVDGSTELDNIKLLYEYDTTAPHNCADQSYGGVSETPFGSTETAGFSGADGTASFTSTPISFSSTSPLCMYVVLDVLASADSGDTIELEITDPSVDVLVSDVTVFPETPVSLSGGTTIVDPNLTQNAYHWRLDTGNESATSTATGGAENTPLSAVQKGTPRRLRVGISNEGATTSLPVTLVLEYGVAAPSCAAISSWLPVHASAQWTPYDSSFLAQGGDTTNIDVSAGGVSDGNTAFITDNNGILDTTATSSLLTVGTTSFLELEYSIQASTTAVEGETYCFRVTRSGTPLGTYSQYPQATIAADVTVSATGTQTVNADVGANTVYAGGVFRFIENTGSRAVTDITLTETGSVNAETGLSNIQLRYESDTVAPYDCASVTYSGGELPFGLPGSAFSGPNGTVQFSDSVTISTTSALCVYLEYDVTTNAAHGETINVVINSPSSDIEVTGGGSVGPSTMVEVTGTTTLQGGILTQTHYHWRRDNGTETTASSATNGVEDTALIDFTQSSPIRLRLGISNEGPTSTVPTTLTLEYGLKITTCSNVSVWTDVSTSTDEWDMYDSLSLVHATNTINIATTSGGVSDENITFLTPNSGVRESTSETASLTLSSTEFVEYEFSLTSTADTAYETTYCFRLTAGGTPLPDYDRYPEVTMAPKRDFKIQRGVTTVTGTSTVITAGVDYVAPASTSSAFIRITNTFDTGAGRLSGGVTQNADDVTAHILDPGNLLTSIRFSRPATALAGSNTRVAWEIIEFVGEAGTDGEMVVRGIGTLNFLTGSNTATSTVISTVANDEDVVVFVTGAQTSATTQNYYTGQFISYWSSSTNRASFRRGASASTAAALSFAVVEFVGANWAVQRVEHAYATTAVETKSITPVNSLSKAFLYSQKLVGAQANVVNYGHEVWLSSLGAVSFRLEPAASVAIEQVSVAWVIENTQQGNDAMSVQRMNGNTSGGGATVTLAVDIPSAIEATNNASVFGVSRAPGANTQYPNPQAALRIVSTTTVELFRSATAVALTYRIEVVEWPVVGIGIRQNRYRIYADSETLTPDDPWPVGVSDVGENTVIGVSNGPPARGDRLRLRMNMTVSNANMPAGFRSFKLQYGLHTGSCTAIETWTDVGSATSSAIWRGFTTASTTDGSPVDSGNFLIPAYSDVAGRLVHQNPSAANPYSIQDGEDVEYDWHLEHNGAVARSTYCFRMVQSDDTPLDGYFSYPQIRTAGYNPVTRNWRWYSDVGSETPVTSLAAENTAPINLGIDDTLVLRVAVAETKDVSGSDIDFRLQFSDDATFAIPRDVIASSTCTAVSLWCYVNGGAADHATVTTATLASTSPCSSGVGTGCGRHVSSGTYQTGHTHTGLSTQEHSFTLRHAGARVKAVYYFRLYDSANDIEVPLGTSQSYPSLLTESPILNFAVADLPAGTSTAGIVTDATTTSSTINFGRLALNTDYEAAHRLSLGINATDGYQLLFYARQPLMNNSGDIVAPLTATNSAPVSWVTGCPLATSTGCVGYHTTDPTLSSGSGGSATRFALNDTYAGLSTTPQEIMYSSIPTTDSHDIIYRVRIGDQQPAGDYSTEVVYLAVPVY